MALHCRSHRLKEQFKLIANDKIHIRSFALPMFIKRPTAVSVTKAFASIMEPSAQYFFAFFFCAFSSFNFFLTVWYLDYVFVIINQSIVSIEWLVLIIFDIGIWLAFVVSSNLLRLPSLRRYLIVSSHSWGLLEITIFDAMHLVDLPL